MSKSILSSCLTPHRTAPPPQPGIVRCLQRTQHWPEQPGKTPFDNMETELYGAHFFDAGTFDWETHESDEKDEEKTISL